MEEMLKAGLASLRSAFPFANCRNSSSDKGPGGVLVVSVYVPCLSLQHHDEDDDDGGGGEDNGNGADAHRRRRRRHHHHQSDRKQVEEYASRLLARPLLVSQSTDTLSPPSSPCPPRTSSSSPFRLLENVSDSFGTLVDSRLRAYATFLARHGVALARRFSRNNNNNVKASSYASSLTPPCPDILSLESKVKSLLALGESVRASLVTVEFHVEEEKGEEEAQAEKEGEGGKDDPTPTLPVALLRRPVSLEVTMQVEGGTEPVGPTVNDAHRHHSLLLRPVRMQARGYATVAVTWPVDSGSPSPALSSTTGSTEASATAVRIDVELDTRQLLNCMIHQASDVVAAIVSQANTSEILPESKLSRSSSYLAMPPPPNTRQSQQGAGLVDRRPPLDTGDDDGNKKDNHPPPPQPIVPRRSESFLMLPKGASNGEDDVYRKQATMSSTSIVSPEARAVVADAVAHCALPILSLDRTGPGGDDDDEDEEYFFQDLSPEVCETIVDGIFGSIASSNAATTMTYSGTSTCPASTSSRCRSSIQDDDAKPTNSGFGSMLPRSPQDDPPAKKARTATCHG